MTRPLLARNCGSSALWGTDHKDLPDFLICPLPPAVLLSAEGRSRLQTKMSTRSLRARVLTEPSRMGLYRLQSYDMKVTVVVPS